jgi:5-methylcytosine-specific restriction endonuclease McrA
MRAGVRTPEASTAGDHSRRRCLRCGRSNVPLQVHHRNGDPMDNRIANTIPLCRDCHHEATFPGT